MSSLVRWLVAFGCVALGVGLIAHLVDPRNGPQLFQSISVIVGAITAVIAIIVRSLGRAEGN